MKRLLYISPTSFDYSALSGVQKKIMNQSNAFVKFGFEVDVLSYYKGKIQLYHTKAQQYESVTEGKSKTDVLFFAPNVSKDYDYVYIRYPMSDLFLLRALKAIKKSDIPIVLEIPTYPYDSEGKESLKGRFILMLDKFFRNRLYKYVDRICTYSDDDVIFGVPTIKTINGYDFSIVKPDSSSIDTRLCINMIAVSSMFPLHGYDRLIKGMGNYYSNGGQRNLVLHIVGSGYVEQEYKKLTETLRLKDHVVFHGKVFGADLMELYKGQALGVNSLAIHRDNLSKESTLKTKEYAALGLPIISSSYVDAFSDNGNRDFTLRVPADESDIEVEAIISFLDELYSTPLIVLRNCIRNDAKAVCDMTVTLRPIVEYFNKK